LLLGKLIVVELGKTRYLAVQYRAQSSPPQDPRLYPMKAVHSHVAV
jgi:hypothetical protein